MNCNNQNLNIAVVQTSSSADEEENLRQVNRFLIQASEGQADLVLLPENVLCHGSHNQIRKIAKSESEWLDLLRGYSIKNDLTIVWGGIPVRVENKLFNMSLVINQSGELIAKYAKNHLFFLRGVTCEADLYLPGTEKSESSLNGWRIALSICFDLRFPEFYLQYDFPDLILCSAAFTQQTGEAHWELLCRTRAVENQCYFAAANQHTISKEPFQTFGHTMLITPFGDILATVETDPNIILSVIDKRKITETREKMPLS